MMQFTTSDLLQQVDNDTHIIMMQFTTSDLSATRTWITLTEDQC